MSRAANLKRDGKESVWARRRREKEKLDEMLRRNEEEATKEVEKKLKAEEAGKKADEKADEAVKEIAEEVKSDQKTDRRKLDGIKPQPSNKELENQIKGNTQLIGKLADQIGDLTGGVEKIVDFVGQHDQVLGEHGRRISALEKATGILDSREATGKAAVECRPVDPELTKSDPEPTKGESIGNGGNYYGYLYFPVDKYTGKIRWDLPFRSSVDAADCKISCSWRRRLFCFNAEGKVLREATPEESSKFSCA